MPPPAPVKDAPIANPSVKLCIESAAMLSHPDMVRLAFMASIVPDTLLLLMLLLLLLLLLTGAGDADRPLDLELDRFFFSAVFTTVTTSSSFSCVWEWG